ncbi:MAG: hypothetical protein JJU00_03565 [Opitutales bacterium]|nr:hypothetical protein [Opitutales bacterium]
MAPKKKEERPVGLTAVMVLAALAVFLGAALAFSSLAVDDVREVNAPPPPDEREPGQAYWVKGDPGTGTQRWRTVRSGILTGFEGEVVLSEGDVNQWSRAHLVPGTGTPAGGDGDEVRPPTLFGLRASATAPDFRIEDGRLHVGTTLNVAVPGGDRRMVYQVSGTLRETADGLRFRHENSLLGRAPLGYVPVLSSVFAREVRGLFAALEEAGEIGPHLRRIESASIEDGELVLVFGPEPPPAADEAAEP